MRRSRVFAALVTILLTWLLPGAVMAGKNAGGALIVHTQDSYVFSASTVCTTTYSTPASCEEANTRSDKSQGTVVWILAAFDSTATPGVSGIYFGIDYDDVNLDPGVATMLCGPAGSVQLPDGGWPYEGRGNTVAFGTPIVGNRLFPFYVFKIDGGTDSSYFSTGINPTGGYAAFIDDGFPPATDEVTKFGTVKWYADGENDCPGAGPGDEGDTPSDPGIDGSGETPDASSSASHGSILEILATRGAIEASRDMDFQPRSLEALTFRDQVLAEVLRRTGATFIRQAFPGESPSDTVALDITDRPVRKPDLSNYYYLWYSSPIDAERAKALLAHHPAIRNVQYLPQAPLLHDYPNDPLHQNYPPCSQSNTNAQWNIWNNATRSGYNNCADPITNADNRLWRYEPWPPDTTVDMSLALVDVGIRDDHEDLNVIRHLTADEKGWISTFPDADYCGEHGTHSAGPMAARTNNYIGIAGICSACSLLDVNVAYEEWPNTCANQDCEHVSSDWVAYANAAFLQLSEPRKIGRIVAMNLPFGRPEEEYTWGQLEAMWAWYTHGIVLVASSGNWALPTPTRVFPASVPFVLAVGGMTWDNRFWDVGTSCYLNNNGTTVGPDNVDICAPASGSLATTHVVDNPNCTDPSMHIKYTMTLGQTSEAAAQVTGTIGLMQTMSRAYEEPFMYLADPDLLVGVLEASALPFREAPDGPSVATCGTCPREQFGWGGLNVAGAMTVLRRDRVLGVTVDGVASRYGDVDSFRVGEPAYYFDSEEGRTYGLFKLTAFVTIPYSGGHTETSELPPYCAWVSRIWSGTFERYYEDVWEQIRFMRSHPDGPKGCKMAPIREGGHTTVEGYIYGYVVGDHWEYPDGQDPEWAAMYYHYIPYPFTLPEAVAGEGGRGRGGLKIQNVTNPWRGAHAFEIDLPSDGEVRVCVIDAAGRQVETLASSGLGKGVHRIFWDTDARHLAPGVYWIQLTLGDLRAVRQLVVVN